MDTPELAVAATRPIALDWTAAAPAVRARHWQRVHGDASLAAWLAPLAPTHLHFGSEFCEHLLPSPRALRESVRQAGAHGLRFALLTPVASPGVIERLDALLPMLSDGMEVVANDWGVAHLVATRFPSLGLVAGRVLCRMTKDPRLDAGWAGRCGHALAAPTARKLASVRMVKSVVDRVRGGADDAAVRDFAMALRPSEAHCATGFMCYYPEVLRTEAN